MMICVKVCSTENIKTWRSFFLLLRRIVATIDAYGLKKRYLGKYKKDVERFFRGISREAYRSEIAKQYQKRFQKNENALFTFLDYDITPWNNNNAEHALSILPHIGER